MRPSYGIDAMPVVRNLSLIGFVLLILAAVAFVNDGSFRNFRWTFLSPAVFLLLAAALMVGYALVGKFRHRDRMLRLISWRGDERVLDVGTGRGLLMIGAAKKLDTGRAYGIDIFNAADLSGNKIENTRRNTEIEGVSSKTEVVNEDARKMSFPDAKFDVVLSNLCLHNIPNAEGRAEACREIARVLKPGGRALISDFQNTAEYAQVFCDLGLEVSRSGPYFFDTFPPLRIVNVRKS
ncbi:MAG: class I SAM-dependent methyltransferase [Acidobacteriota bacterium]